MTHQKHCAEVELENATVLEVAGLPRIEGIKAFAVSFEDDPRLDYVAYEDAHGKRIQLSAADRDPLNRALYSMIMKEAGREEIEENFRNQFYQSGPPRGLPTLQQQYGTYGRRP